jgi:hypothetical protein
VEPDGPVCYGVSAESPLGTQATRHPSYSYADTLLWSWTVGQAQRGIDAKFYHQNPTLSLVDRFVGTYKYHTMPYHTIPEFAEFSEFHVFPEFTEFNEFHEFPRP